MMVASQACFAFIAKEEAFRERPYLCSAGVWTIGFGTTFYEDGTPVKEDDKSIDRHEAFRLLKSKVKTEFDINKDVTVELTQNQFDALTSFAYNVGMGAFRSSTLLKKLNNGDYIGVSNEFERWNKSKGKVMPGLVSRRAREKELFLS